jgi:prepilin-type N-terminal cleavage/methylation domain-containing protein
MPHPEPSPRLARRRGFTLIELLVVIAIIAVLIGLLLPAVQKVREAANRSRCQNNLKQIALGCTTFHDARGYFPQGGGDPGGQNPAVRTFYFSWPYHIYPFIEQANLYDPAARFDAMTDLTTVTGGATILSTLDKTPVAVYYCPSRRSVTLYHGDAVTDYAGNMGTNGSDGVIVLNNSPTYTKIRVTMISDGTSNTMLIGERRINLADINTGNDCYDNEPAVRPADDCDVLRKAQPVGSSWLTPARDANAPDPQNCGTFGGGGLCQFGSSHADGILVALCDGSVRRVGYAVDPTVFKNLCVRNDGQAVDFSRLD